MAVREDPEEVGWYGLWVQDMGRNMVEVMVDGSMGVCWVLWEIRRVLWWIWVVWERR